MAPIPVSYLPSDILLICPTSHRASLYHHIHSDTSSSASLRIDLQTYDEVPDTSVGTCTLLRHFANRIPKEFVIVPCDFIAPPSLPLSKILNKFRANSSADGSIATTCWIAGNHQQKSTTSEEWGQLHAFTPILWETEAQALLYIDTSDDLDRDSQDLELKMALLNRLFSPRQLTAGF